MEPTASEHGVEDDVVLKSIDSLLENADWGLSDLDTILRSMNVFGYMTLSDGIHVCSNYNSRCAVFQERRDSDWSLLYARFPDRTMHCFVGDGNDKKEISVDKAMNGIDLDVTGMRWEGGVKDSKPFGYGVLYDEEGRVEYEGFMLGGSKTCFGREYYPDITRLKYVGWYYDDHRYGRGVLYDRTGGIDYEGLWMDDRPTSSHFDGSTINSETESVEIPDNSFNDGESVILPHYLYSLQRIVIGNGCFKLVRLLELDGLNELESVVIGKKSFVIDKKERSDGTCRIVNCPKLKSIEMGDHSLEDYRSFELNNLPSLQSINIGGNCLRYIPSFSLIGMTH